MASSRRDFAGASEIRRPFKHFVKAILAECIRSKRLMLPEKFARVFKNELGGEARLELPNGRIWTVGLTREVGKPNRVWLDLGFDKFMAFHSITEPGYLLTFKFHSFSHFKVVICDLSACEIDYQNRASLPSSNEEEEEEEEEEEGESNDLDCDIDENDEDSESEYDCNEEVRRTLGRRENVRDHASGSRRKPARVTRPAAGPASAAAAATGQSNRGKRPRLMEEESDGTTEASQSDDDSIVGRGRGRGRGRGVAARRNVNVSTYYAETASGRDGDLWRELMASNIEISNKFQSVFKTSSRSTKTGIEKAIRCNNRRNPSTLVIMKKYHVWPGIMSLPTKFADKYFPRGSEGESVMLRAYDENGEFSRCEWVVKTQRDSRNTLFFRSWAWFRQTNCLARGDVCLLELVDQRHKVFDVRIFRAL